MLFNFSEYFKIKSKVEYDKSKDTLINLRNMFAGEIINKGFFRVLENVEIDKWKEKISKAYPRYSDKIEPFACDWLGRFYCIDITSEEETVIFFNIGKNEANEIPMKLQEFLEEEIPSCFDEILDKEKFDIWLDNGDSIINKDDCIGYITPIFMGGEHEFANLDLVKIEEYWDITTKHIKELPYLDRLLDHYEYFFGTDYQQIIPEEKVKGIPQDFCVVQFNPTQDGDLYVYTTVGMSNDKDKNPIELCMFSVAENTRIAQMLCEATIMHNTKSKLELATGLEFDEPWFEGSKCNCGVISPPYIVDPDFEQCDNINCLWFIPITKEELDFKNEFGLESLEQSFADAEFNFLHYFRESTI